MTGLRQVKQILSASSRHFPPTVICGDFNAQPDSLPVQEILKAKYAMVHPPEVMTNWGPNPLRLDHIFCPLAMEGEPLLQHTPQTPFTSGLGTPSLEEPSDHLPIVAVLKPRK
jgi:endonuclease/exonuclease/phosphatase family metal-dependent hydrolase